MCIKYKCVYVYIHIHIYTYSTCIYTNISVFTYKYIYIYTLMFVYIHVLYAHTKHTHILSHTYIFERLDNFKSFLFLSLTFYICMVGASWGRKGTVFVKIDKSFYH